MALDLTQPIILLQLGGNVAGLTMAVSALHILCVNTHLLPEPLRPAGVAPRGARAHGGLLRLLRLPLADERARRLDRAHSQRSKLTVTRRDLPGRPTRGAPSSGEPATLPTAT